MVVMVRQSGSVIILILVAVALFAALSYTMMRGGAGSQGTLTDSQARLAAMEIIAYGDAMEKAVQKLRSRGCSETQFDFSNTVWTSATTGNPLYSPGHNSRAPSDGSCAVFGAAGDIEAQLAPKDALRKNVISTGTAVGAMRAIRTPMPEMGSSQEDLALFIPFINVETCLKINSILGVENIDDTPPLHSYASAVYNGTFGSSTSFTDMDSKLTGHNAFCTRDHLADPPEQRFFKTLIER